MSALTTCSVPVLWDKKEGTIVNNESSEIMRIFNSEFNHLAKNPDLDLFPETLRWGGDYHQQHMLTEGREFNTHLACGTHDWHVCMLTFKT